jgi:parallel beta-helix repeat protein
MRRRIRQLTLLTLVLAAASLLALTTRGPRTADAAQTTEVPVTDNLQISASTKLKPGVYTVSDAGGDGVIQITGDNVTVDGTGVTIVSAKPNAGFGVAAKNRRNVIVRNITVRGFDYGVTVEDSSGVQIVDSTITGNRKDTTTCFLQIRAGRLGGGILFRNVTGSLVQGNRLYNQSTGLEMINSSDNRVLDNETSLGPEGNESQQNSCWGIRLEGSSRNLLRGNRADYVNRERYPCQPGCDCVECREPSSAGRCLNSGDSAGVLLVTGSHGNQIVSNSFTHSGDGFFLGNGFDVASNDNYVYGNDGSASPHNAFEATFSRGNVFENNEASTSNYGFWLGYSYRSRVTRNNVVSNRTVGIEIEHGFQNEIDNNVIWKNVYGVYLRADPLCSATAWDFNNPTEPCGTRAPSADYSIHHNSIVNNVNYGLWAAGASQDLVVWRNNLLSTQAAAQPTPRSVTNDMKRDRGIAAQSNWWGTAAPGAIAEAILDHDDDPSKGFVNADLPLPGLIEASVGAQVTSWTPTAPLPVASSAPFDRRGQQLVFHNNRVYVFGGRAGDQSIRNVYFGDLLPDGRVRTWTPTTDLPAASPDHVVVRVGDHVFFLTGASGLDAVYHNRIAANGALGPTWDVERARLPTRQSFAAATFGDFIYVVGGNSGGLIDKIRYIKVKPDGHLLCDEPDPAQCWRETQRLPNPMQAAGLAAYDGRLYVIAPDMRVLVIPLQPDGSIRDTEEWRGELLGVPMVPRQLDNFAVFGFDSKLFVLAGSGNPSVYVSQLSPNGAPGQWQTTLNLPPAALLRGARVGAYKDFVYTVGGFDGTTERAAVHVGYLEVPGGCRGGENLNVPFTAGVNGPRTTLTYTGPATLTISGVGRAAGQSFSDAFYNFADPNGTPITPTHTNEFSLTINGRPAHDFMAGRQVPAFRQDHRYVFRIDAPPGPLTFGVGDGFPSDNGGSYRVGLCGGTSEVFARR